MNILFTGGSSFSGYWFIQELLKNGHQVFATFTKTDLSQYSGIRATRISNIIDHVTPVWDCRFGDEKFIKTLDGMNNIDMLCHHAADATNYKSDTFNIGAALNSNTNNIVQVIQKLKEKGCENIISTGSVFESNEGDGTMPSVAFSPYGLSKQFTYDILKYFSQKENVKIGKFVIPNPFGPYEDERYTHYLINTWIQNGNAVVKTPDYIRDNIHIDLLARSYAQFVNDFTLSDEAPEKCNPSGYTETMGEFTGRFAKEISKRLSINCNYTLLKQTEFPEPHKRINTEPAADKIKEWNEEKAWDRLAFYYRKALGM